MTDLTLLFNHAADAMPPAAQQALERSATGGIPARGPVGRWLSGFMGAVTGSAASLVPAGSDANAHFNFLRRNFGSFDAPELGGQLSATNSRFEHAINQHGMNIPFDNAQTTALNQARREQRTLISNMEATLEQARSTAAHAVPQMMTAVEAEANAIRAGFESLIAAVPATGTAPVYANVGEVNTAMGFAGDAQRAALVREVAGRDASGAAARFFEVQLPGGRNAVRIGQVGHGIETAAVQQVQNAFDQIGSQVTRNMSGYLNTVNTSVNAMRDELNKAKTTFDRLGTAMKQPPVYAAPTAAAAASTAPTIAETAENVMKTKADPLKDALSIDKHKIQTNTLGVVGEEEASLWNKLKSNVLVKENVLSKETGLVTAVERGVPGKLAMGGGIAVSLGAIAMGIKGFFTGRTDENGQSVPSDSGDMLKNGALVVGGAAGLTLLGLNGFKAKGGLAG